MLLPEIVAAGIYSSQFCAKNTPVSKNRKTTRFEIELPMENGGISYIGDTAMPITPNMIICAKPGQVRHTKFPYKCYFVHIVLHGDILYDTLLRTPDIFQTDKAEIYQNLFTRLIKYYASPAENEIILQSLVLELIHTISRDGAKVIRQNTQSSSNALRVDSAIQYIKGHLTEDLSLEAVSAVVSLSPIHFHSIFKAAVGKTLREYVEEQRIKKAVNLLLTTDASLTQIAYECGFSSQSYFSYVFKRRMHKTPREYIREIYNTYEI